jgi:hypothetical protein
MIVIAGGTELQLHGNIFSSKLQNASNLIRLHTTWLTGGLLFLSDCPQPFHGRKDFSGRCPGDHGCAFLQNYSILDANFRK